MDPLHLLIVWTIAAIVLIGIASAIDVIIASRLGYPRRRRVFVALISFLVLSVGFLAIMLLLLHTGQRHRRSNQPRAGDLRRPRHPARALLAGGVTAWTGGRI